jgi:hypothetical protein
MISVSVGIGTGDNAYKAGLEACDDVLKHLTPAAHTALIVFASVSFDQDKLMEAVEKSVPGATIVGCSTAGEMSSDGLSGEHSVVIMGISSDTVEFLSSVGHHVLWNPKEAGAEAAGNIQYRSRGYAKAALLFFDVITGKGEDILRGAIERCGEEFPLFGAAAGDDLLFFETYQYEGGKAYTGSVVALGFVGDVTIGYGRAHGFLPIGTGRTVTRSEGTTLYEIDNKPAVDVYKDYFGDDYLLQLREGLLSGVAVTYPLGVDIENSYGYILRNPIFVDAKGAMTFTANIPVGSQVRLMLSGKEEALASAEQAAKDALNALGGKRPKGAIILNSIARRRLLGVSADEEVRIIQRVIGRDVPIAGFYGYAEVGGAVTHGMLPFHNSSVSVLLIAE